MPASFEQMLGELEAQAARQGLTVKYVSVDELKDFAGMHSQVAKVFGFDMPSKTIYILNTLSPEAKYHTLRHELIELHLMQKGMKYWSAHVRALRGEKKRAYILKEVESAISR